jgi:hypothetical protein
MTTARIRSGFGPYFFFAYFEYGISGGNYVQSARSFLAFGISELQNIFRLTP